MSANAERCTQISVLALALKPDQFLARCAELRRGGFSSGSSEVYVSASSSYPIPLDEFGNQKDRTDRELQVDMRTMRDCIDDAWRLLQTATALQGKWLFPIAVASEELRELASDAPACMCGDTREVWLRRGNKTPWRIKAGLGPCCYGPWTASGRPDKVLWLRANRMEQESA